MGWLNEAQATLLLDKYRQEEIRRLTEKERLMRADQFDERSRQSDAIWRDQNDRLLQMAESKIPSQDHESRIVTASDAGDTPATISRDLDCSLSTVYAVLRRHRPTRRRAPRPRGSDKANLVAGLLRQGHKPARVAQLARCSRAWVYRVQANGE